MKNDCNDAGNILDVFIIEQADSIYKSIIEKREDWKKEEDVRHGCNHLFDHFIEELGKKDFGLEIAKIKSNHEVRAGGGSIDTVYGNVLIEYKRPKHINSKQIEADVINQIEDYFNSYSAEKKIEKNKLLGVGCDGFNMFFITNNANEFDIESADEISIYHIKKILKAIVRQGLIGRSYTAENLADDFGSSNISTKQGIKQIYDCIENTDHPKAKTIFSQWKMLFGEVCGFDVEGKNEKISNLADFYEIGKKDVDSAKLLFSVHTYYSLFMKLMAAEILSGDVKHASSFAKRLSKLGDDRLQKEMSELENGSIWSKLGIKNLLEGDLFSWYLSSWGGNIADAIRSISERLSEYDPSSIATDDKGKKDLLKSLYQMLFPKTLRHDLGEYYTPDWLAELVLDELGYGPGLENLPQKRLLDPACGSGTFLVEAINRVIIWNEKRPYTEKIEEGELLRLITSNIFGFDLNPLAVIASRVNYLMAISELVRHGEEIEIPVYLCDSIMTPSEQSELLYGNIRLMTTVVGDFKIPVILTKEPGKLEKFSDILEQCIENESSTELLLKRCQAEKLGIVPDTIEETTIKELYQKILALKKEDRNGIWVRIIRNAFAPLFSGQFDFVAGNPPWINWESLPVGYRNSIKPLWFENTGYGLFTLTGSEGRLGGGKKDLSILMTYVAHDNYLKENGKLGFVITQSVFKTKGGGEGFRTFCYAIEGRLKTYIRPLVVHDMSSFQPFEGATNRTAVFICDKSTEPFSYPVPYAVWKKTSKGQIDTRTPLKEAIKNLKKTLIEATPVDPKEASSPWLTASKDVFIGIKKVIGKSDYKAFAGAYTGGLNGCFWVQVLQELENGNLLVQNLHDVGKKKVEKVQTVIESDLVYPLLRGRDVRRWLAKPSASIILAQDAEKRKGIPEDEMQEKWPKTYSYLLKFKKQLLERASGSVQNLMKSGAFYSMFAIGPYTMSPWKVVWTRVADDVKAGVLGLNTVSGNFSKPTIPIETATLVDFNDEVESNYFCALINSTPSRIVVISTSVAGTGGFAPPNILEKVFIPKFDPKNKAHAKLARLSMEAHKAAKIGDADLIGKIESEIDTEAAKLWGITPDELAAIQAAMQKDRPVDHSTEGVVDDDGDI